MVIRISFLTQGPRCQTCLKILFGWKIWFIEWTLFFPGHEMQFLPKGDWPKEGDTLWLCWKISLEFTLNHLSINVKVKVKVNSLSRVWLFATPWTAAHQAPPSMGFSRQEYWSGFPFPSPGDLSDAGIEPGSPAFQADTLTSEPPRKSINVGTP